MFMGDHTLTLIKHVKTDDGDVYTCHALHNASWFSSVSIVTSGDGAKPVNTYTVRVENAPIAPEPGDYVTKAILSELDRISDLKGFEHFRITAVGNNQRGGLPHWRLSGS